MTTDSQHSILSELAEKPDGVYRGHYRKSVVEALLRKGLVTQELRDLSYWGTSYVLTITEAGRILL